MITFNEIAKWKVLHAYPNSYHRKAQYFEVLKADVPLCIYGVVDRGDNIGEASWILDSFKGKVISKSFLTALLQHVFSLKFEQIYTWSKCKRIINVFSHLKKVGVEKIDHPSWDTDTTKTWFMKRQ